MIHMCHPIFKHKSLTTSFSMRPCLLLTLSRHRTGKSIQISLYRRHILYVRAGLNDAATSRTLVYTYVHYLRRRQTWFDRSEQSQPGVFEISDIVRDPTCRSEQHHGSVIPCRVLHIVFFFILRCQPRGRDHQCPTT